MEPDKPQRNHGELESSEVSAQEVDDLYDETERYFFTNRDRTEVSPASGSALIEAVETPVLNGRRLRFSRERPSYVDDPTRIAEEAPLAMVDAHGRSVYHTPVDVEVLDDAGETIQRFTVMRSGPDRSGKQIAGLAQDRGRALDEEQVPGFHGVGGVMKKAELNELMLRMQQ